MRDSLHLNLLTFPFRSHGYRYQPKYFYSDRSPPEYREGDREGRYKQNDQTSFRGTDPYRKETRPADYDRNENHSATRHVSSYDDDISDIENSVLRGGIWRNFIIRKD